jgi:hypothetical protein
MLPADPEMITAVAALCAAETACCPHTRFLLEVTAGQVILAVEAPSTRVRRWHEESTPLRAHLSHDGAIMLADPALGGNAPCKPPTPDTRHARDEATPTTTRQPRRSKGYFRYESTPVKHGRPRPGRALRARLYLVREPAPRGRAEP